MINNYHRITVLAVVFTLSIFATNSAFSQDTLYNPQGNPDKWNVSFTPFLLLPNVSGEVSSEYLEKEFGVSTTKFVETLNATIMLNAEVWKGKFFFSPTYIYNHNEINKDLWQSSDGDYKMSVNPSFKKNILDLKGGMRINFDSKLIIDPYVGVRYTSYRLFGTAESISEQKDFDETEQFWDPIIGIQIHYFPTPRIPVEFRSDFGGFGVGSKATWTMAVRSGYSISPLWDVLIGFAALSNEYERPNDFNQNAVGLTSLTYGLDFGFKLYLTGRAKDPNVFKKFKNK